MRRWRVCGLIACVAPMIGCAKPPQTWTAAPPPPPEALAPCSLHRLPPSPTLADLEAGYMIRGAQILSCDAARRLALEAHPTALSRASPR